MATLIIDEETKEVGAQASHQEMFRGVVLDCWHNVGSSIAVLCKGEARDSLTPLEDVAATYATARVSANKLLAHIEDCPQEVRTYPENKAVLDILDDYVANISVNDINHDRPESVEDPKVLFFVEATMSWIDFTWTCMEQKKGRKARAVARAFTQRLAELRSNYAQETPDTQEDPS